MARRAGRAPRLISRPAAALHVPRRGDRGHRAVSGGADSLALLVLARAAGCAVTAVHVDHGLREGTAREADVVRDAAARFGAAFRLVQLELAPGPNLEARAREARYAALPPEVLTGHTVDDRAETMLLNLLRGAGPDGLAARLEHGARRPLLALRRAEHPGAVRRPWAWTRSTIRRTPIRASSATASAPRCCRCSTTWQGATWPRCSSARPGRSPTTPTCSTSSPVPSTSPTRGPWRRRTPRCARRAVRAWLRAVGWRPATRRGLGRPGARRGAGRRRGRRGGRRAACGADRGDAAHRAARMTPRRGPGFVRRAVACQDAALPPHAPLRSPHALAVSG